MEEIWKDIKGFEGLYQVSNIGRIKSLSRKAICNSACNIKRLIKDKVLTTVASNKGYIFVSLRDSNGNKYTKRVHRLVAEAFIDNPNNYPIINHKDCDRSNNCVENLEWCTYEYNNQYTFKMGYRDSEETRRKKSLSKIGKSLSDETKRKISESNKRTKRNANQS